MNEPTRPDEPRDWRELLDCMRPGRLSEDSRLPADGEPPAPTKLAEQVADDPELQRMLQRSEAWDRKIAETLQTTPVPLDLAARLEQQLAARVAKADDVDNGQKPAPLPDAASSASAASTPSAPSAPSVWSRRRVLVGAALTAAACLTAAVFYSLSGPAKLTSEQLVQRADTWASQWAADAASWNSDMPPGSHPIPPTVDMSIGATTWRQTELLGDPEAVVYRSAAAKLVVIRASHVTQLGPIPPNVPQFQTGRRRIGAWAGDGLVYVLIVPGNLARYQSMLQRPFDA